MTRMYAPTSQAKIELRQHRLVLSRCSSLAAPLLLFLAVVGAYCATVLGILVTGTLAALMLVPLCGMLVIALFVIGHDACHQSYTCSRFLNHVIGRVAFLPALHSFSLWDREQSPSPLQQHQVPRLRLDPSRSCGVCARQSFPAAEVSSVPESRRRPALLSARNLAAT